MRETDKSADTKHKYDDILDCPHHVSSVHPSMPLIDRAAQFAPFSALTGYEEVVKEEARLTEQRVELDEEELERLDQSLQYLKKRLQDDRETNPDVKITYFCADQKKEGGQYRTVQGKVRRIRQYEKAVELEDRTAIPIKDIVQISRLSRKRDSEKAEDEERRRKIFPRISLFGSRKFFHK